MNTYRNRRGRSPWHGVKPARKVTPEQLEATRMALQIRDMCDQLAFDTFIGRRMADASMETLREIHASLTAPAIERANALEADYRQDQADRLDYARGQF